MSTPVEPHANPDDARRQLKILRERKREISRAFGAARRNGEPLAPLKACMTEVQQQIKALEARAQPKPAAHAPESPRQPQPRQRPAWPLTDTPGDVRYELFEGSHDEWDEYALSHPAARIYHGSATLQALAAAFGLQTARFVARHGGQIIGTLALARQRSRLFGDFLTALPFFNYGGALAQHADIEHGLMHAAGEHAADLGVEHVEFRDDCPRTGWPARTDKLSMLLDLPDSSAALLDGFSAKVRAQIRRPQREHPTTAVGGVELLSEFHQVFSRNMRDLGTPVYPQRFFAELLSAWQGHARLVIVRLERRPVAAAFVVGHAHLLEIPWASSLRAVNHLSINMLLYWTVLQFAIDNGYRTFDFGRTTADSATHRFKAQWGAGPLPLYWHYWLPPGAALPALNPNNPRYALMIAAWKRLPVPLANLLGGAPQR